MPGAAAGGGCAGDGPGPALPPARDPAALWWLIAAATVLAAALTALLVYAPR